MEDKIKCPSCGGRWVEGANLDYRVDDDDNFVWTCFECDVEWKTDKDGVEVK